jgi:hypothetical protein
MKGILMPRPDFRLRFVGRFVFATTGKPTSEIVVIALNMAFNPDLQSDPHRTFVTVPRASVKTRVSSFATLSTFAPTERGTALDELFVWDAGGNEVSLAGVGRTPITLSAWGSVPDLGQMTGDHINPEMIRGPIVAGGAVTARFHILTGAVRAFQFDPLKRVSFEPLEELAAQTAQTKPLPDAIEVDLHSEDTLTPICFSLRSQRESTLRSIVVPRPNSDADPPVTISITNLCSQRGGSSTDDREFAAYYDLMTNPPPARKRLVPHTTATPSEGAKADCTGLATVGF